MPVHFDEQDRTSVARQADVHIVLNVIDGGVVHKFQRTGHDMGGDDASDGLRGALHVRENRHHGLGRLGRHHELEDGLAGQRQRAFGGDEQFGKIVAVRAASTADAGGHGFARLGQDFKAEDIFLGGAVFQAAQAAGVFGDVAAEGGDGHGTGVRRIEEALRGDGGGELGGDDAGFDHGVQVFLVDFDDLVQALRQDDHGLVRVGNRAAAEVGARAAYGHGQAVGVAAFDQGAELFGGGGTQNEAGNDGRQHGGVVGVALPVRFAGEDVLFADEVFEFLDEGCAGHDFLRIRW